MKIGKNFLATLSLFLLGFIAFHNSLHGSFIWDDFYHIQNNVFIKDWRYLRWIFVDEMGMGSNTHYGFYRPLTLISYALDYRVWGLNVVGYHLTNLFLHLVAGGLLYRLTKKIFQDSQIAWLTAAFFLVHPVQVEAVSYLSDRSDSLSAIFIFLSFLSYLRWLNVRMYATVRSSALFLFSLFCLFAGLLSRESAIVTPVLFLIYHKFTNKRIVWKYYVCVAVLLTFYFLIRVVVFETFLSTNFRLSLSPQNWIRFFWAMGGYLKSLVWPFGLHFEYGSNPIYWWQPQVWVGAGLVAVLVSILFREWKKPGWRFFGAAWFLVAIFPVCNLLVLMVYPMTDHWLYLPSVGFFIGLAMCLAALKNKKGQKNLFSTLIIILLTFYSLLTMRQNLYWQDERTFSERTLRYEPQSYESLYALGLIEGKAGHWDQAIKYYEKALQINPLYAKALYNLGNMYAYKSDPKLAIEAYQKAIKINPKYFEAYNNLGNIYDELGDKTKALAAYEAAFKINPKVAEICYNLGVLLTSMGQKEKAETYFQKLFFIDPYFSPKKRP